MLITLSMFYKILWEKITITIIKIFAQNSI